MRKVAVYAGTRNVYPCMAAAAKSLLHECRHIDQVYFLTEDDAFPEELPDVIRCINVKDSFTKAGSVNYENPWTWMTMARLALHRILPDEERVLYLDVDTIVMFDMSELFDADLDGCLIGGIRRIRGRDGGDRQPPEAEMPGPGRHQSDLPGPHPGSEPDLQRQRLDAAAHEREDLPLRRGAQLYRVQTVQGLYEHELEGYTCP